MEHHSQGIVDSLDFSSIFQEQDHAGLKLTFTVPTEVTGQSDTISALTLKNQVREAKARLLAEGVREVEAAEMLSDVVQLLEDTSYWRLQSRGLAIFVAKDFFVSMRVPIELSAGLTVGTHFNLLPLAPVLASDRKLYVLALSKNSVRLFETTRNLIHELALENIPASFDEVIDELPERIVDVRAGGAGAQGTPSFHGPDGDADQALLEKYIREIGQAVGVRLGTARSQQLVLAAVAEYHPLFKSSCPYPAIFDGVIAGNPEHLRADQLRSAAWRLVNDHEAAREATEADQARSFAHAGKGSFDLVEIMKAAELGRVDTLYLPRDYTEFTSAEDREFANLALIGTLKSGGVLRTLTTAENVGLATFRY